LRTDVCLSVFNNEGRFDPQFDSNAVEDIQADSVIFAIGQSSDLSFLAADDGVESLRGLIKVNPGTYQTTAPDVFACGDIAHGPRLFIDAIASAQIAARSMHDFLRGTRTDIAVRKQWKPAAYTMAENWHHEQRVNPSAVESARRATSIENVEICYSEAAARTQANRCLRCNVNTVFNTELCIACNGCVDVCPENLIKLVGLSFLPDEDAHSRLQAAGAHMTFEEYRKLTPAERDELGGVMLKDESTCIRCALCATRCPTSAITMQKFEFYRECVSIPSPNPKILYPVAVG
jgi:formate dehydrogenase beta subunit